MWNKYSSLICVPGKQNGGLCANLIDQFREQLKEASIYTLKLSSLSTRGRNKINTSVSGNIVKRKPSKEFFHIGKLTVDFFTNGKEIINVSSEDAENNIWLQDQGPATPPVLPFYTISCMLLLQKCSVFKIIQILLSSMHCLCKIIQSNELCNQF